MVSEHDKHLTVAGAQHADFLGEAVTHRAVKSSTDTPLVNCILTSEEEERLLDQNGYSFRKIRWMEAQIDPTGNRYCGLSNFKPYDQILRGTEAYSIETVEDIQDGSQQLKLIRIDASDMARPNLRRNG